MHGIGNKGLIDLGRNTAILIPSRSIPYDC